MYLNLIQVAESFGVSEKVVEDWIRHDALPHVVDRGRLLFDRAQVAGWAAARGLAGKTGHLAPAGSGGQLEPLLRLGKIWREVAPGEVVPTFEKIVAAMPGANAPVAALLAQRLRAPGGVTYAPIGRGFALPHPSSRVALGRGNGILALLFLRDGLPLPEAAPDTVPVTRLFFFIAASARGHLELLGRLTRLLAREEGRGAIAPENADGEIFRKLAEDDARVGKPPPAPNAR